MSFYIYERPVTDINVTLSIEFADKSFVFAALLFLQIVQIQVHVFSVTVATLLVFRLAYHIQTSRIPR